MYNMIESYWLIRGKFMKFLYKLKAFTLAEVMITLTIIGVISAIVVPVAFHSRPDENVMKFKKAHNTLYEIINTLVTSDKYYCKGDLGIKADCETELTNSDNLRNYFCQTIADLLSTKNVNCISDKLVFPDSPGHILMSNETVDDVVAGIVDAELQEGTVKRPVTSASISGTKAKLDSICKKNAGGMGEEIVTTDDVVYYNGSTVALGGLKKEIRQFTPPNQSQANFGDELGNDISYKIFCIDIDGIPDGGSESCDDNSDLCPFGYGIRADGKIMNGARADEWLEKDIQMEN